MPHAHAPPPHPRAILHLLAPPPNPAPRSARLEYLRETFQIKEADYLAFDAVREVQGWVVAGGCRLV